MEILNPRIKSCAILQRVRWIFQFFGCQIILVHFWKKTSFVFFFQKWTKKIWQLKNWNCHPNRWTISLLVMRRFLNYTKFHCYFNDRKCRKLWRPAPSLCAPPRKIGAFCQPFPKVKTFETVVDNNSQSIGPKSVPKLLDLINPSPSFQNTCGKYFGVFQTPTGHNTVHNITVQYNSV